MDWNIILTFIFGGSLASVITLIMHRKPAKRKAEAQADHEQAQADHEQAAADIERFHGWEEQIKRMNDQIEVKDERIEKLNQQLADKEDRFCELMDAYRDQTKRLRESQDREYGANAEIQRLNAVVTSLTEENGNLRLELKDKRCHRKWCLDRQPQNENTRKAIAEAQMGKEKMKLLEAHVIPTDEDDDEDTD